MIKHFRVHIFDAIKQQKHITMQKRNCAEYNFFYSELTEQDKKFYTLINKYNNPDFVDARNEVVLNLPTRDFLCIFNAIDRTKLSDEQVELIEYIESVQFWQ